jgi:hypothetical protein
LFQVQVADDGVAEQAVNIHVVGQMTDSRAGREAVSEACQGRREVVLGRRVVLI